MPIRGTGRKGDLYVKFAVEMPGESWASRQDVVGGVSTSEPSKRAVADQVEHKGGAAWSTARNGPITNDGCHSLLGTAASISGDLSRSRVGAINQYSQ